jgi:hypothetical protein
VKKLNKVELLLILSQMRARTGSEPYRHALKQTEEAIEAAHVARQAMLEVEMHFAATPHRDAILRLRKARERLTKLLPMDQEEITQVCDEGVS